ncbi:PAS domain S-box-containing protein [Halogranum gelatinilyticum]|uniref:PAS domain S-box-containing protein n=1 Tax=Halogranum gelatinilyticum TaxID=660521 RepID=A0A1G9YQW8_9EURY|nr:PAS domain-containing protein [Halogranum gelatinilyticum]SDN10881.1 PAS domain S-box-containing protein [Halogranum gelatinilyticum]
MSLRRDLTELFSLPDDAAFRSRARDRLDDVPTDGLDRSVDDALAGVADEFGGSLTDAVDLDERDRRLVWRVRALDEAPLGVTLSGPAYQDNPILYANATFRDMTGYPLTDLVGENPRLLQGPETERAAVEDLREALAIWEPVTVELTNYRKDGTPFRNRVSLVPLADETGTITNWLGIQKAVDGDGD